MICVERRPGSPPAEVVADRVQVECRELVVESVEGVFAHIDPLQVETDRVLLLPGVHPVLVEPAMGAALHCNGAASHLLRWRTSRGGIFTMSIFLL
jgi:hypothetical protein